MSKKTEALPKGVQYLGPLRYRWQVRRERFSLGGVEVSAEIASEKRRAAILAVKTGQAGTFQIAQKVEPLTLGAAIEKYAKEANKHTDSAASLKETRALALRVLGHLETSGLLRRNLQAVSKADLIRLRDKRLDDGVSQATVAHEIGLIGRVYESAQDWGHALTINPARGRDAHRQAVTPRPKRKKAPNARRLESDEIERMKFALNEIEREACIGFVVQISTGLRIDQVSELKLDWIKDSPPRIEMPERPPEAPEASEGTKRRQKENGTKSKNFRGQVIPISTHALEFLLSLPERDDGYVLGARRSNLLAWFTQAAKKTGIKNIGTHTCRHHFNSLLLDANMPREQRAIVLAQESDQHDDDRREMNRGGVQWRYSHHIDEKIRSALEAAGEKIDMTMPPPIEMSAEDRAEIGRLHARAALEGRTINISDRALLARVRNGKRGGRKPDIAQRSP